MRKCWLLLCVFVLASCGSEDSASSGQAGDENDSGSTVDKVASSVQKAGDTAADWTRKAGNWMSEKWDSLKDSSAENSAKAKESLDEATVFLNEQIDSAQQTAARMTGAAKAQVEKGIEGLKQARDEIADAGSRVSDATAEQWPELKKEVSEAWSEAGESMKTIWRAAKGSDEQPQPDN